MRAGTGSPGLATELDVHWWKMNFAPIDLTTADTKSWLFDEALQKKVTLQLYHKMSLQIKGRKHNNVFIISTGDNFVQSCSVSNMDH